RARRRRRALQFHRRHQAALEVLKNGCLSWHEPYSNSWYQAQFFGSSPKFIDLGSPSAAYRCMRQFTNRGEVDHLRLSHVCAASTVMRHAVARRRQHVDASAAFAEFLDERLPISADAWAAL